MRTARGRSGSAAADYVGAVAAVGLVMLALVAVREHHPQRRPPVDPVAAVAAALGPPPAPRVRPTRAVVRRPRARPARRQPRPRATVLAPVWAIGW